MKVISARWAALAAAALITSACAGGGAGAQDGGGSKPLTIAFSTDVTTLNPWMTKSVQTDMSVISQIYQTLTVRSPDMSIKPLLAESWDHPSADTWNFKLRSGVKYSNGDPFDSSVVKWNIERVKDPATKARIAPNMSIVKSVETPDANTVTITTKTPDTTMPALMSYFFFVDPKWAPSHDLATQPMGTGAYTLASWTKNSQIQLKARADYWGAKVGYRTVNYKILPDPAAQIAALQTGEVDVITAIGPDQMERVKAMPNVTSGALPTIRSAFLMLNTKNKPLDDVRVRQALNYAVDKDTIVKNLFHSLIQPSPGQMITEQYSGFNKDLTPYSYDPGKAKQLLAQAGHGDGFTMTLTYPSSTYLLADKTTQVIKEQLAAVGVTVQVQPEPFASWLSSMYAGKIADAVYLTYAWPTLDGLDVLRNFGPGGAQSFWTDQSFGASLTKAQQTADPAAHAKAISDAAATMREQAPFVFLFPQPLTYAYSSSVSWKPRPDDWVRADEMSAR